MKTDELREKGLTDEQISFVMAENGKDLKKLQKEVEAITADRDKYKTDAETAAETLKGFEGKDFDAMQKELESWKKKAEDAEKDYNSKLAEREKADLLKEAMDGIQFTSESAKESIMRKISESVTVKNGKLIGFNDLLEDAKKNDASAFKETNPEQNRAKFTEPKKTVPENGAVTKDSIMAIKNREERLNAIAKNKELFQ